MDNNTINSENNSEKALFYEEFQKLKTNIHLDYFCEIQILSNAIRLLKISTNSLQEMYSYFFDNMVKFDFENVPYNGYRSFIKIIYRCIIQINLLLRNIQKSWLKKNYFIIDFLECSKIFNQLIFLLTKLQIMMDFRGADKCLFVQTNENPLLYKDFIICSKCINYETFYGKYQGFYLSNSIAKLSKFMTSVQLSLATSLAKESRYVGLVRVAAGAVGVWWRRNGGNCRAVHELQRLGCVRFYKLFWNMLGDDSVDAWRSLFLPRVAFCADMTLQLLLDEHHHHNQDSRLCGCANHENLDKDLLQSIKVRLISSQIRRGMKNSTSKSHPPSDYLVFHIHGGAFISQTPKSHDAYLRVWARELGWPIVSVDYGHAPEHPFPFALIQCLAAYRYVLQNLPEFGCSNDDQKPCRVLVCGDSAGANLALSMSVHLLQTGCSTPLPHGILMSYPALQLGLVPSPSHLITCFDPLLQIGVLSRALIAYQGLKVEDLIKDFEKKGKEIVDLQAVLGDFEEGVRIENPTTSKIFENAVFDEDGEQLLHEADFAIHPTELLEQFEASKDPRMSPILAEPDILVKLPPFSIVVGQFDPLLDDSVEFCKLVRRAGHVHLRLVVIEDANHGLLNLTTTPECQLTIQRVIDQLRWLSTSSRPEIL